MSKYRFSCTCVACPGPDAGEAIAAMVDSGRAIARSTFLRLVERADLRACEQALQYDTGHERGGLRMAADWHVAYFRGVYRGHLCAYFVHSAIEWIFVSRARVSTP